MKIANQSNECNTHFVRINIPIPSDLHASAKSQAARNHQSLKDFIVGLIRDSQVVKISPDASDHQTKALQKAQDILRKQSGIQQVTQVPSTAERPISIHHSAYTTT